MTKINYLAMATLFAICSTALGDKTTGQVVDDSIITTRVKTAIADADFGAGIKINVDTYNGVVLLTGFVDSGSMKTRAGSLAAKVENVRDVVNGIYVLD